MTNNSYSVANGGEVNALRRGGLRQRHFRNGMERSSFLSMGVKFALQVLLRDVEIVQVFCGTLLYTTLRRSERRATAEKLAV